MKVDSWLKIEEKDGLNFDLLRTKLTVTNPEFQSRAKMGLSTDGIRRFDNLYQDVGDELWVPRSLAQTYVDKGHKIEDNRVDGLKVDFRSKIKLGPNEWQKHDQKKWVRELVEKIENSFGVVGQAEAGWGKTVASLEVINRLGRTTAVLVHKEFLMNQWAERIEQFYDIKSSEIGYVQQDRCEFEGKKIVMLMVQSLLAREYPQELFNYFGTVVTDEVHRFGAVEFRRAITMFPAKYRFGVTATPKRSDGLEKVFFWHIGDIGVVGQKRDLKPKIEMIKTNVSPSDLDYRNMSDFRGEMSMPKMLTWLAEVEGRNRSIVKLLMRALEKGRKIIVLSDRREHLNVLRTMTRNEITKVNGKWSTGFYVGGMNETERAVSSKKNCIFGTYQMAAEGLDIPDLDTLFLVTPKADIEQSVGRILRESEGKKEPMVIDLVDEKIGLCVGLSKKRLKQYKALGYIDEKN